MKQAKATWMLQCGVNYTVNLTGKWGAGPAMGMRVDKVDWERKREKNKQSRRNQREGSSGDQGGALWVRRLSCPGWSHAWGSHRLSLISEARSNQAEYRGHPLRMHRTWASCCFKGQCSRCPLVSQSDPWKGFPSVTESLDQYRCSG